MHAGSKGLDGAVEVIADFETAVLAPEQMSDSHTEAVLHLATNMGLRLEAAACDVAQHDAILSETLSQRAERIRSAAAIYRIAAGVDDLGDSPEAQEVQRLARFYEKDAEATVSIAYDFGKQIIEKLHCRCDLARQETIPTGMRDFAAE